MLEHELCDMRAGRVGVASSCSASAARSTICEWSSYSEKHGVNRLGIMSADMFSATLSESLKNYNVHGQ